MRCKDVDDIGILIKFIDHAIKNEINRNLSKFNLTMTQEKVLWHIFHEEKHGDVFQKHIEEKLNLTNPTVTGIVKRLEEKEMIVRRASVEDARYKCLTLTKNGREVIEDCRDFGVNYIEKKLTKDMNIKEVELLKSLLKRVLSNMES